MTSAGGVFSNDYVLFCCTVPRKFIYGTVYPQFELKKATRGMFKAYIFYKMNLKLTIC